MAEPRGFHLWTAEQVAQLRAALGVSQGNLAQRLGVRQQTVSDWETGLHAPQGAARRLLSMVADGAAVYVAERPAPGPSVGPLLGPSLGKKPG